MKFMKLGSKPDAFQSDGNFIRYVASELAPDVIVIVGEVKFYLHKFPLLSKSNRLQTLISNESDLSCDTIQLDDFPGGPKAFEICAKFCYGMTVTLNPYIVAGARCAAEYLEMTEDVERGNLVFKIEVFLNSSILRSWKDSIIVLQTTKSLLPWSEDLRLVARCVDSVASKISVDPANVSWSYTCNRRLLKSSSVVSASEIKTGSVPTDWWVEDICELEMDLYKRVVTAVRSKGKTKEGVIGEALRAYTARWVPESAHSSSEFSESRKNLIETIASLLPPSGVGCSCNFLLRLLKFAILVDAEDSTYEVLLESISTKIDEASVDELLIPARVPQAAIYDVELVKDLVRRFVSGGSEKGRGVSWVNLGKLVDGYLKEVARDPGLNLDGFVELIRCVPESARPIHDGLYDAIDIYLQEHPCMTKADKKKLCGQMDVRKLTTDASMHAAQNERLPLRTVVQVLYFEQSRAAAGVQLQQQPPLTNSSSCCSDDSGGGCGGRAAVTHHHHQQQQLVVWEKEPVPDTRKFETDWTGVVSDKYPQAAAAAQLSKNASCKNRGAAAAQLLPSRSRRIFDKIWAVRKGVGSGENRSSETSGSSQSPNSLLQGGETNQSSGSSSRNRRHSIS